MRKIVVALMLLLPLLFVLTVFSSVKTVSLGIPVSAGGINIIDPPEGNTLRIDLSNYRDDYALSARVTPDGARCRDYFFRTEGDCVSVEDGKIQANSVGKGRVIAVSKDGGFEDSVNVLVFATSPFDFDVNFYPLSGGEKLSFLGDGSDFLSCMTGRYRYEVSARPKGIFADVKADVVEGFAEIDRETVLFPFEGKTTLSFTLKGRMKGEEITIEKRFTFELSKVQTQSKIVINGGNSALVLGRESDEVSFFAEGDQISVEKTDGFQNVKLEEISSGRYKITLYFGENRRDFTFAVTSEGGGREEVSVAFSDFDFAVRSNLPVQTWDKVQVLIGVPTLFYVSPSVYQSGVTYEWNLEGTGELSPKEGGTECLFCAGSGGESVLKVRAMKGGVPLDVYEKRVEIVAVKDVKSLAFDLKTQRGLSKELVVGGKRIEGGNVVENSLPLPLLAYDGEGKCVEAQVEFSASDENIARIEEGKLYPVGSGRVTVTASWAGNRSFGTNISSNISLYILKDGVEVATSEELFKIAQTDAPIVLKNDIVLGTDERGEPLPLSEREQLLKSMRSTYNTQFYAAQNMKANVRYILEFCGDVYGNGCSLNAGLFSAEKDGSGRPRFFKGPLDFVSFGSLASVAAQDNICFLIRKDGLTLRNLTLLGCFDEALYSEGETNLSALDSVGTTLEVNASANIINCRIKNGRNVLRVYGGNRVGDKYFSFSPQEAEGRAERERIKVNIEGCILSQGREFVLKMGANGALSSDENTRAPSLTGKNGEYPLKDNSLYQEKEFYEKYVFTDVTLKDSVLEKSGLFLVGVESNFSGELLQKGGGGSALNFEGWAGTGGTSFASILRLVGDVRLYDWKELKLIDSSTLIKTELPELKLDIAAMLGYVSQKEPEKFGEIVDEGYVHGGIAFYGGGKNYSCLETENLKEEDASFGEYFVNISVLEGAEGSTGYLGRILPSAAGDEDFRFYLYQKSGPFQKETQERDEREGKKYEGVRAVPCV